MQQSPYKRFEPTAQKSNVYMKRIQKDPQTSINEVKMIWRDQEAAANQEAYAAAGHQTNM